MLKPVWVFVMSVKWRYSIHLNQQCDEETISVISGVYPNRIQFHHWIWAQISLLQSIQTAPEGVGTYLKLLRRKRHARECSMKDFYLSCWNIKDKNFFFKFYFMTRVFVVLTQHDHYSQSNMTHTRNPNASGEENKT